MVRVLSYNIFYKAMSNDPIYKYCTQIIENKRHKISYTICLENVSRFIEKNRSYDFVCLQEATNWNILRKITPCLNKMNYYHYQSGKEEMVTFYDPKYQLDMDNNQITGHMGSIGRPFVVLFFSVKLCIINVHAGHHKDIYNFDKHLARTLKKNSKYDIDRIIDKLKTYDIIMAGDFNDDLRLVSDENNFRILTDPFFGIKKGRALYGINNKPTCCDPKLLAKNLKKSFDHILCTFPSNQIVYEDIDYPIKASDHVPVISKMYKNIGYDFDGVLHLDVAEPDEMGQRNPFNMTGPYRPFDDIVDQIENDILMGYKVYIITARFNNYNSRNTIINHLLGTKLRSYIDNIVILFTNGRDKTKMLRKLRINTYYEDSCLRAIELYRAKANELLPYLSCIYYVIPEKRTWYKLNNRIIANLCSNYL